MARRTDPEIALDGAYQHWKKYCQFCGKTTNAAVTGGKLPPLPVKPKPCAACGSPDTLWKRA